jgi:hypothetical protein
MGSNLTVVYRGVKIVPIRGKRSPVSRIINEELRKKASVARRELTPG